MLYIKNLPIWERILRASMSIGLVAYGMLELNGLTVGYIVMGMGAMMLITGFLGFCPLCAMVGRKLERKNKA
jgi:hypothetical protein